MGTVGAEASRVLTAPARLQLTIKAAAEATAIITEFAVVGFIYCITTGINFCADRRFSNVANTSVSSVHKAAVAATVS